jgi:putative transposase
MAIEKELLDQLLAGRDPKALFAKDGLLDDLKKALSERILNAELDEHLEGEQVISYKVCPTLASREVVTI